MNSDSIHRLASRRGELAALVRWGKPTQRQLEEMRHLNVQIGALSRRPLVERFWPKVQRLDNASCWPWLAARSKKGYGEFQTPDKHDKAHRIAWELTNGPVPTGKCVCHKCDNPPCCNPDHLFLGTTGDNTRDSVRKGRFVSTKRGETHCRARLTADQVHDIRKRHKRGEPRKQIAALFGVSKSAIDAIVTGRTWKHI